MIELYGNKIWNSNTPNKYKKVIIANEDSFDNICQELENSGLNYCAYIFNGEAHIAIGRATATNIDKLDIDYQTVIECNSKVYKTNNIIGTTTYDSIEDKLYRKYNTDFAYKIGQRLTEQGILFSGRIYGKTTTITVDEQYADTLNKISAELKEQRASFMSKSEIVQNESPEELKSVDEKISELHFNESQLSALAPSVKFIQTRNDDNLTDNFVSLFSDCTDFYESQLSALAEIYVDTYQSFSDKSLMFADTSRFNDLKQRFVNDNITAKLTDNRGYSTTQLEIIREMVTYGMSESVINLLDYTFSTDEMQNYFSAYKNGSYEDLINIIAEIKGTTRTDIEGQIEGGTYTPKIPEIAERLTADTQKLIADVADAEMIKSGELTESESYYAKELINSYCRDEFDSEADFSDLKKVGVAYTTTEDSKHTVEAVVNLVDYRLETYVDDKLFKEKTYSSLKDMIDNCLYSLSFDDLVYLSDDELAQLEPKEHRAVPLAENDYYNSVVKQDLKRALYHIDNAKSDAERNFYQNNFDIKVRNYAGALNVSSEEIVNQFNSENEIVPINEPEQTESVQEIIRPTITCDWSESPVFENGKTYSVSEFDKLMKNADDEWVEQRQLEIEEYGSENAVTEAYRNGELDNIHLGYEKTKFIINMPNGTKYTERQNIGDGIGGVIDFLEQYSQYSAVVKLLKDDIAKEEQAAEYPEKESNAEKNNNNTELNSIDELAMQLENDEKSTSEKSSVGKNNFIWTSADEHAPVTSQPTLFDSMPVSDVSSDETTSHENYVLEDRESVTGAKTKYRNNITAIKVLKQIEAEYRTATPEEQKQLSLYSGWGGLANAFESDNDKWKNEYSELKGLLTDEEYTAARSTVLDSFYTDTAIVDSIYEVIRNAGFEDGNILEPAMGVGNFFGRLPEELRDKVNLYGVEKDSLSGRIAQKLYPQADITIDGFENTRFNDNSFDVAIGNIPFGDFSVNDSKYNSKHLKIHDYFFLKSLDKVRDGGIVAFVTSKGTLDKKDSSFRKTLAERADLVGAVRLPNNAFKSAGTEVTADIIFLQKREKKSEIEPSWVHTGQLENGLTVNNYFVEHPEMILGEVVEGNKMFGRTDDTMCVPFADGRPLSELLPEAVKNIVFTYSPAKEVISPVSKTEAVISKPEGLRSQSYYKSGNEIYFYGSNSAGELVTVSAKDLLDKKYTTKNIDRLTAFMEIRDTLRELLEVQQHDNNDAEVEQLQHRLNTIYDNFYDKYGLIHSRYNRNILGFDGAYQLVASLEQDYDKNTLIKKSDIFTQRVNVPKPQIEHIDTASEALAVCIAEKGYIDFDYMSNLTDIDKASLEESLRNNGEIYPIPMNTENNEYTYQTASEYLSGDIYAKLDTAESYAAVDNIYSANVTALKAALPTPLKAGDIDVNLGATWIAPEYYEQFMYKLFETPLFNRSDGIFKDSKISVEYSEYSGKWFISHKAADKSVTVTKTYGACGYSGYQILEAALNLSEPKVYKDKLDEYGRIMFDKNNKPIRVIDVPATQVVQQKANKIRREFKNWLFSDPVRRSDIVDTYNRTFNCIKPREYDGSHLTFPGMNSNIELHEHQKNAIAHAIYGGNTLFAHSVGAGKSATRS